ncbi:hypothetical protein [Curtobacterium sp. MCBA15_004]|uniref:hypothetical protein n=1 Tax=unclassified Curtobacterium TaxID=257496 RepID=UPI001114C4DE|nr:hypothetical protein [Curtobacterium sp. MCBA15_004]WIA97407.1 hypothetical protein QOL16_03150 [Curtobacterium sp. MCBA15_004]
MTSTVLLTAAVTPNTQLHVAQSDPAVRLEQYKIAIARWVDLVRSSKAELVVVETSGVDPDEILTLVPGPLRPGVRVMTYQAPPPINDVGKGPMEVDAIRRGLAAVALECGEDRTVYKATGRLVLANAARLVRRLEPHEVAVRMTVDRSFADTRFLGASVAVWRDVLLADVGHIDERAGVFLEHVVAGSVARASAIGVVDIARFPERPVFAGQSGSTGKVYDGRAVRVAEGLRRRGESLLASFAGRKQV